MRIEILGEQDYALLEPDTRRRVRAYHSTSQGMRDIMVQFHQVKLGFTGREPDDTVFPIDLGSRFRNLTMEPVVDLGTLKLTW